MSRRKVSRTRAVPPKTAGGVAGPLPPAGRKHFIPGAVWAGLLVLELILTACPRFSLYYVVYLAVSLVLAASVLGFLRSESRGELLSSHLTAKKLVGYSLVLHYVAAALPRVDWANAGDIGDGRSFFLFSLALLSLAAGLVFFVLAGRPSVLAGLGLITEEELRNRSLRKKKLAARPKGALHFILEWVDALAFAAIAVILVNIFVFQLYVVPSESMVPTFLTGDRPFTVKFLAGPRIPLTDWRLPELRAPVRGDVVTIANPRYPENYRVDLKKYLAQFVSMLSFTSINIDSLGPDGQPKADPLVKRIVGLPGEKLMMVDDILYARRKGEAEFKPVEADRVWAKVDLWKEPVTVRERLATLPADERDRELLGRWDRRKAEADPAALAAAIGRAEEGIRRRLASIGPVLSRLESAALAGGASGAATYRDELIAEAAKAGVNPISARGAQAEDLALLFALGRSAQLRDALDAYVRGAAQSAGHRANAYELGSSRLNLLVKKNLLARLERDVELIAGGASLSALVNDPTRSSLRAEAEELAQYLYRYDERSFPEFPVGGEFLGPDEFFAMGDNRYNSLDFRFKTATRKLRALDPSDPASLLYQSMLAPFALERRFIEGYAIVRVWPPSRLGVIR